MNNSGFDDLDETDLDDLGHHVHSDLGSDVDEDPYFEYNKCNKNTKMDVKELTKINNNFKDINLRRFFFKQRNDR